MQSFITISHLNINFRPVESSISRINLKINSEFFQGCSERLFSKIPHFGGSEVIIRSGAEFEGKSKSKKIINIAEELKLTDNFGFDLVRSAKDMGVILMEFSHSGQSLKRA